MEPQEWRSSHEAAPIRQALIVSELRFLCESLVEILGRFSEIEVCGTACTLAQAVAVAEARRPTILLFDVAFPGGADAAARLCSAFPEVGVIALGIFETEEKVLAWAEAGVRGYVPNTASIADLGAMIMQVSRGEQACSSRIAGSLLRRVAETGRRPSASPSTLTRRELEIVRLVGEGFSNKDIARRLRISVGTAKSHVHNVLGKLSLQRRAEVMAHVLARDSHLAPTRPSIFPLSVG
jgi:DNA-binding NarL/FixJ family response regulator